MLGGGKLQRHEVETMYFFFKPLTLSKSSPAFLLVGKSPPCHVVLGSIGGHKEGLLSCPQHQPAVTALGFPAGFEVALHRHTEKVSSMVRRKGKKP